MVWYDGVWKKKFSGDDLDMKKIFLTRHGETEWNKAGRLQGWRNSPLTVKGTRDATLLGIRMSQLQIEAIYTSPLPRAKQTTNLIKQDRNIPVYEVDGLKEIFLGDWEGKTKDEIRVDHHKEFSNFWNAPHLYDHTLHNAEGLDVFKKRVQEVVKSILDEPTHQSVLIVAHAVVLKAAISFFLNASLDRFWDPPFIHGGSLTLVEWDGEKFKVEFVGDTSHLEEGLQV
jgi:broad specificity phosphatase PhoE